MKCMDCGMDGLYWWQIHYPGNDPENGPAHAPAAYRRCYHCGERAREDSDFCQAHYEIDSNMTRERELCEPCSFAQKGHSEYHGICDGCKCTEGTCDPYRWNEEITYYRSSDEENS